MSEETRVMSSREQDLSGVTQLCNQNTKYKFDYDPSWHRNVSLYPICGFLSPSNCRFMSLAKFGGFSAIISLFQPHLVSPLPLGL